MQIHDKTIKNIDMINKLLYEENKKIIWSKIEENFFYIINYIN